MPLSEDDAALNQRLGRALGFTIYHYDKSYKQDNYYMLMDAEGDSVTMTTSPFVRGERATEEEAWADLPPYATSLDACAKAELVLIQRGLMYAYVDRLLGRNSYERCDLSIGDLSKIITASPRERCEAMIAVLEAQVTPHETADRSQWRAET